MSLALQLLRRIDARGLDCNERALLRCELSKELTEAGNFDAACDALGDLWRGVGEKPVFDGLNQKAAAEILLRAGTLSGWIGSARQIDGAQEIAKDLISESLFIFESIADNSKAAEARIELAWCYGREGAYDEARVMLADATSRLDGASELKAVAGLRQAAVEWWATRFNDALGILNDISHSVERSHSHALKGKFHNTLAHTLEALGDAENRRDYTDRALIENAAASYHFEQAGHTPHYARVENNLGFLLFRLGQLADAQRHLDRARKLFVSLKDASGIAQVDETLARTLLAQGRNSDAERIVRGAVNALRKGGERASLAEALTTQGTALARLGRVEQATAVFEEAVEVAERAGDSQGAGRAALALIEELGDEFGEDRLQTLYERADQLLSESQHVETLNRLRNCARRVFSTRTKATGENTSVGAFLYASDETASLVRLAQCAATTGRPVLITGETGTGKEVLARLVHGWSGRKGKFVAINCAALNENLLESQLFGHRKGSFTDAFEDYRGAVCEAGGGTLFLDEVGELSPANQAKLLRLIECGEVFPVGSPVAERVDVRIIAATNHNLYQDMNRGHFRSDLFYRLSPLLVEIPPLRERPEDIPVIARHFIERAAQRYGKRVTFTPACLEAMKNLSLRGNARELRALIERTFLTAQDGAEVDYNAVETLALRQTQKAGFADAWAGCSLDEEVRLYEMSLIRRALDSAGGRLTSAARLLGITHQGLSFILNGRQKELLKARQPIRRRSLSIVRRAGD
ncbi:MAG TPA: sigma 54-interacting transcriptional regulator [Pyrinomonadaceae bacterium]|nr:sigma 54-interacting transcriptional regulator [Pyrinomonadaceae bacterium]